MDQETAAALEKSIEAWEQRAAETYEGPHGTAGCALCHMFHWSEWSRPGSRRRADYGSDCDGCPVFNRTKRRHCRGTPFDEWEDTLDGTQEAREAAQREVEFLKSLRESVDIEA